MIVHQHKNLAIFKPESGSETTKLEKFPGLLREGQVFFSPLKQNVVSNLVDRLKRINLTVKCTKDILPYLEEEIQLCPLPSDFTFYTKPLDHQLLALRIGLTLDNIGFLLEPGLGKTKIVYDFIWAKKFKKSLIICPKSLLFVWEVEVIKHRPELKVYVIKSTNWEKEISGISEADVVVVNYDKCVAFEHKLTSLKFPFVCIDEGLIKNIHTDRTKSIFAVAKYSSNRAILSGTLINNSPVDLFSPIKFIEPSLLGVSITRFKDRFCIPARFNKNVVIGYRYEEEMKSALEACCVVMTKEEWLKDLPKKVFHNIEVTLSEKQREAYLSLSSNWICCLGEGIEIEVDNPLPLLSKLTQIANGFIYYGQPTEDENLVGLEVTKKKKGERLIYEFPDNPKVHKLLELVGLNGRLEGRRSIIWFNLGYEKVILERTLQNAGLKYLTIAGGDKNISDKVKEFNENSSIPYLICQSKTINYGVTIMGHTKDSEEDCEEVRLPEFSCEVSDEIFFSIGFSLEVFLQQQDRIHRIGQKKTCNYWVLSSNSSVERKVSRRLEEKLRCNRDMLVDIAKTACLE